MNLKRILMVFVLFASLLPLSSFAALSYFVIEMSPVTVGANKTGDYFNIVVTAKDEANLNFDYTGKTVSLTANGSAAMISPSVSGAFASAQWSGTVSMTIAGDPVTIAAIGEGNALGSTLTAVGTNGASKLVIVFPDQTYTPGLGVGVTPVTPTAWVGNYYPVTVYATDNYYNRVSDFSGTIEFNTGAGFVTPATFNTSDGRGYFNVRFDNAGTQPLTSVQPWYNSSWQYVQVNAVTQAFVWLEVPAQVIAGEPFRVTATASASSSDPSLIINSLDGDQFTINRFVYGTAEVGQGIWTPTNPFTMGNVDDGKFYGTFTYSKAEALYLRADKQSGGGITAVGKDSSQLLVLPAGPANLDVSVSPGQVEAGRQAIISVVVRDEFMNLVPNALVSFTKTQGSADAKVTPTSATTNDQGLAQATFTGGIINETATVQIQVNSLTENTQIKVSVASTSGDKMINYPNPVNPVSEKTSLNYYLRADSDIEIRIYDAFGRLVLSKDIGRGQGTGDFINATVAGGANFDWDGRNGEGKIVANGIYLVRVTAKTGTDTQKFERRVGVLK